MHHSLIMSSKPSIVFIFLSITTLLIADHATSEAPTQPNYFYHLCQSNVGNYTANGTYEANLESVLSDLQEHASLEVFYNSSVGSGANTVYGQYYCRGDIDSKLCGACIQQASQSLFGNCTLFKSAIIWFEECTLRYTNESVVGVESVFPRSWGSFSRNVSDPAKLVSVLGDTVDKLINKSTQGTKPSLFATGDEALSAFESVYCLVQCSPDLNAADCETCLRAAYAFIPTCCGTMSMQVAIFYATSCQLRYSTFDAFYAGLTNTPPSPPPPPGASSAPPSDGLAVSGTTGSPPSTTTNTTSTDKGASEALRSSVGVAMTALALLVLVVVKT